DGETELEIRVQRRGVREEVGGAVLEALVQGKDQKRPVGGAVAVEQAPQAHPLAVGQRKAVERELQKSLTLSFHFDSLQSLSFIGLVCVCQTNAGIRPP